MDRTRTCVWILWPLLFLASVTWADNITVGTSCDHRSLASALLEAASTSGSDSLLIAEDLHWTGGQLILTDEAPVTFRGVTSCADLSKAHRTITTDDFFLLFDNTSATIRDLTLSFIGTFGNLVGARNGSVITLEDATLRGGRGADGGNVTLVAGASLIALDGARILDGDTLGDGGGINCFGGNVVALGPGSEVRNNRTRGLGGGIFSNGCTVNLQSGGPRPGGGHYGVTNNHADGWGGGIFVSAGSTVILGGTSSRPATLRGNSANLYGGGLLLQDSSAEIFNSEIVDNWSGLDGGGIRAYSSTILMSQTVADCERGVRCSVLADNRAGVLAPGDGGAIKLLFGSTAEIRQTYIGGSEASGQGNVASVSDRGSFLLLESSVLFDNAAAGTQVVASDGGHALLAFVSAWGSSEPGTAMAFAQADTGGRVGLYSSIVIEGAGSSPLGGTPDPVLLPPGPGALLEYDCLIAHENASSAPFVDVVADPATVWPFAEFGDPHVDPLSLAVDHCDTMVYVPVGNDIDGEPRGLDLPLADILGPYDLGADESDGSYPAGEIFFDGFEAGNSGAWSQAVP